MKTLKIATHEVDPPRGHMHPGDFVAYKLYGPEAVLLQCDALDPDVEGFMPAARYLELLTRRLAKAAGVGEDIAAEALRNGMHKGKGVALDVDAGGCIVKIERKGAEAVAFPLVALPGAAKDKVRVYDKAELRLEAKGEPTK
jgi:hypothetical protein